LLIAFWKILYKKISSRTGKASLKLDRSANETFFDILRKQATFSISLKTRCAGLPDGVFSNQKCKFG
jgi:hypothetical protein